MTEKELAAKLIVWLQEQQWNIYQEVNYGYGMPVIDIVAVQGNIIWAIETKLSLSMALIEQAYFHIDKANYISICTPHIRTTKGHKIARILLNHLGIGYLKVSESNISENIAPKLNRYSSELKNKLNEAQKTYAKAGNSDCKYWSPFQQTSMNIVSYVAKHPGTNLKDLVSNISHHYQTPSTASACISKWIKSGIIKGIICKQEGRFLQIYLE